MLALRYRVVPMLDAPPFAEQNVFVIGNGTFTDVSEKSGVASASGGYPMTAVAADFDNGGWPDIYVACDSPLPVRSRQPKIQVLLGICSLRK
jgi:hypothetical protein